MKFSNFIWFFYILTAAVLFITEFEMFWNWKSQLVVEIMFVLCLVLITIISLLNFWQTPPHNIFINYERMLKKKYKPLTDEMNEKFSFKGLRFEIA